MLAGCDFVAAHAHQHRTVRLQSGVSTPNTCEMLNAGQGSSGKGVFLTVQTLACVPVHFSSSLGSSLRLCGRFRARSSESTPIQSQAERRMAGHEGEQSDERFDDFLF